jgi:Immunoglobulin I-set domain
MGYARSRTVSRLVCVATWFILTSPVLGQCAPEWGPLGSGTDDIVITLTVFDDGSGPSLYAGGRFTTAGGVSANNIAKWDGSSWSSLGMGTDGIVWAMVVFDDGSGPDLYVSGQFATAGGVSVNGIARWDGTGWSPLGVGMDDDVTALTVFDDGSGPALYAGGNFTMAGGIPANDMAKWNGTSWSPLGQGTEGFGINVLAVFDDGSGSSLYAGGHITRAGGTVANHIARWNGISWSALSSGTNGQVIALAAFDDSSGPALYAGGQFTIAGGTIANRICRWDGVSWSPVGSGMDSIVSALTVFDDGTSSALYAGGSFTMAGGIAANRVARWDGTLWSPIGVGTNDSVLAMTFFDDGIRPGLHAAGYFTSAGGNTVSRIAGWRVPYPEVLKQPSDVIAEVRDLVTFSVEAWSAPGPMGILWRNNGQSLTEDPPRITGTRSPTLRIESVVLSDTGMYDAVLSNVCGSTTTKAATLTVTCYPDCDQSTGNGVLDIFDFLCFQNAFIGFDPYADCDDNNFLDIFDFLCFQNAFVSGCP